MGSGGGTRTLPGRGTFTNDRAPLQRSRWVRASVLPRAPACESWSVGSVARICHEDGDRRVARILTLGECLCVPAKAAKRPSWSALYETASAQAGYLTTKQAAEAGYSLPLIHKHIKAGRIQRVRRGIYRLVHFPAGEHEDLVIVWLWSEAAGVFSHQTALALHELSDALPSKVHVTLPAEWAGRRLRIPNGVVVHYGDVQISDRRWFG